MSRRPSIAARAAISAHPAVTGFEHLGNQAAQRVLRASGHRLQAKLTVNAPGDAFEREADRVADAVVRGTSARFGNSARDPLGAAATPPVVQRACSCGKPSVAGGECADCRKKREEGVQRSPANAARPPAHTLGSATAAAPPIVGDVIGGSGQPLDAATRTSMETRFGANFAHVRVHADARAAASARAVNAHAYTVGSHIAFDAGKFAPGTSDGQRLLAHELAHVVQQTGAGREPGAGASAAAAPPVLQRYGHDSSCPQDFLEEFIWPGNHVAKQMLPKAIKFLNSGQPLVGKIAAIYFGSFWNTYRNDITQHLNMMLLAMEKSDYKYVCENDCEKTADSESYAYVSDFDLSNNIYLCMNTIRGGKYLEGFAETLLHEMAHEFAGAGHSGGPDTATCNSKDSEVASESAECLSGFTRQVWGIKNP